MAKVLVREVHPDRSFELGPVIEVDADTPCILKTWDDDDAGLLTMSAPPDAIDGTRQSLAGCTPGDVVFAPLRRDVSRPLHDQEWTRWVVAEEKGLRQG